MQIKLDTFVEAQLHIAGWYSLNKAATAYSKQHISDLHSYVTDMKQRHAPGSAQASADILSKDTDGCGHSAPFSAAASSHLRMAPDGAKLSHVWLRCACQGCLRAWSGCSCLGGQNDADCMGARKLSATPHDMQGL